MEKINIVEKKITNLYFPANGGRWALKLYSAPTSTDVQSFNDY